MVNDRPVRPDRSDDRTKVREALRDARSVVVLTGTGVSAESGIETYRGASGLWRNYDLSELASPEAWARDPGLVWEFYEFRRRSMSAAKPNAGHRALAELEHWFMDQERDFLLVTQNVDDLHLDAGSRQVVRLHGSIWQTRCERCFDVRVNRDQPIAHAFAGAGDPDPSAGRKFERADLPACQLLGCGGVVRPAVVWFGETLDSGDVLRATNATQEADVFVVVGTSAAVYPAAGLVDLAKQAGAFVVEVNPGETPASALCDVALRGKSGELLPQIVPDA